MTTENIIYHELDGHMWKGYVIELYKGVALVRWKHRPLNNPRLPKESWVAVDIQPYSR
jgi:hypothetical protein